MMLTQKQSMHALQRNTKTTFAASKARNLARQPISRSCTVMVRSSLAAQPVRSAQEGFERFISAASYFLPLADGWAYGRYLFASYPIFKDIFSPLHALIRDFSSHQYAALLTFVVLTIGVVLNNKLSRFTRVHAAQALALEVIVFVPRLLESALHFSHDSIYQTCQSAIWIFVAVSVLVGSVHAALGHRVWLPLVSDSANKRVI